MTRSTLPGKMVRGGNKGMRTPTTRIQLHLKLLLSAHLMGSTGLQAQFGSPVKQLAPSGCLCVHARACGLPSLGRHVSTDDISRRRRQAMISNKTKLLAVAVDSTDAVACCVRGGAGCGLPSLASRSSVSPIGSSSASSCVCVTAPP